MLILNVENLSREAKDPDFIIVAAKNEAVQIL